MAADSASSLLALRQNIGRVGRNDEGVTSLELSYCSRGIPFAEFNDGEINDGEIRDGEISDDEISDGEINDDEINDGEIRTELFFEFALALKNNSHLIDLTLSTYGVTRTGMIVVASAINSSRISRLRLFIGGRGGSNAYTPVLAAFFDELNPSNLEVIELIMIDDWNFEIEGTKVLYAVQSFISDASRLVEIILSVGCDVYTPCAFFAAVCHGVEENENVTTIKVVSECGCIYRLYHPIKAIARNERLRCIELDSTGTSEDDAEQLIHAIKHRNDVHLCLNEALQLSDFMLFFCARLGTMTGLTTLKLVLLASNHLSLALVEALARGLGANSSVKEFILNFEREPMTHPLLLSKLAEVLKQPKTALEKVEITPTYYRVWHEPIGDSFEAFMESLSQNTKLEEIVLGGISLNDAYAERFGHYLPRMTGLKYAEFNADFVSPAGIAAVAAGLERNYSLIELNGFEHPSFDDRIRFYLLRNRVQSDRILRTLPLPAWPQMLVRMSNPHRWCRFGDGLEHVQTFLELKHYLVRQRIDLLVPVNRCKRKHEQE